MRRVLLILGPVVLLLVAWGALEGRHQALHGRFGRADGEAQWEYWGAAVVVGTVLYILEAAAHTAWLKRADWMLPVRGRWAELLVAALELVLFAAFLYLVVLRPAYN